MWDEEGMPAYPDQYSLSPSLVAELEAWAAKYGDFPVGSDYMHVEDDPAFDLKHHNLRGDQLAKQLQRELGADYIVSHVRFSRGTPISSWKRY